MKARPSAEKRRKERERQSRKREKAARVARRRAEEQAKGPRTADGEDPDIAGIVPGPQPQIEADGDSSE